MLKRLAVFIIFVGLIILGFNPPALSATFTTEAQGAVLIDPESGLVLFEQNADVKWYPASMTKIMTLGLALEAIEQGKAKLSDVVLTSENAASYGGSQVYLASGEKFSLKEMLIAIAVGSANDASVAVAEHLSGSEEAFVEKMNEKAKELGALNTNFVNSHGLHDDDHFTTPRDMALIAKWALTLPRIQELTSIKQYTFRDEPKLLILYNTNKLLWWYPGVNGLKTGTTSAAKRNLTASVEREGMGFIGVVMGVDRKHGHFAEMMKLFNWGFANFTYEKFYDKNQVVREIPVSKGEKEKVPLLASRKAGALLSKDSDKQLSVKIDVPEYIPAPVEKGQRIGSVVVLKDDEEINRIDLLTGETIPRCTFWDLITKSWNKVYRL